MFQSCSKNYFNYRVFPYLSFAENYQIQLFSKGALVFAKKIIQMPIKITSIWIFIMIYVPNSFGLLKLGIRLVNII